MFWENICIIFFSDFLRKFKCRIFAQDYRRNMHFVCRSQAEKSLFQKIIGMSVGVLIMLNMVLKLWSYKVSDDIWQVQLFYKSKSLNKEEIKWFLAIPFKYIRCQGWQYFHFLCLFSSLILFWKCMATKNKFRHPVLESVLDPADLYLSLSCPPALQILDDPCTFIKAGHLNLSVVTFKTI